MDNTHNIIYSKMANDAYRKVIHDGVRKYVQMEINYGQERPDTVIFELFYDIAPKTCENFEKLCVGYKNEASGAQLSYARTEFTRIVKGKFM